MKGVGSNPVSQKAKEFSVVAMESLELWAQARSNM